MTQNTPHDAQTRHNVATSAAPSDGAPAVPSWFAPVDAPPNQLIIGTVSGRPIIERPAADDTGSERAEA